ncbi:hypothetical protein EKH77_14370 [Streptomyces luteoverticillatus]|uniref:Uncharacterized protein n=1 Tax=Streptomyces luteoverticillatus TaxID=66425 RepID=A0A3S9PIS4_STRLT|nr:hypothetical protein [Streptomyces luteoverticillatus]AZQ72243.1 hypothetical protein EKH77_14370 [Streptomyces luteoverticillatus]
MSELQAFGEGLSPETRALAQALRDLFAGLEISERRYAARRSYDSSTVSRYLSGQRLPPWEFALNLLNDVAETRGTVPTPETTEMLRTLHHAALKAGKSPTHKVQLLQQQLAVADEDARRAAQRERWLEDTLRDREHRVRELQLQIGGFRAGPDQDADRARLLIEIRQLKQELEEVREAHRQAEERCERLERKLADAERQTDHVGELGVTAFDHPGVRNVFNGHVYINDPSRWAIDEAFVASLTVLVRQPYLRDGDRRVWKASSGLLVDASTVVAPQGEPENAGSECQVYSQAGEGFRAEVVESSSSWFGLAVLRLAEPLPGPVPSFTLGRWPAPASRLLVNGYAFGDRGLAQPHSCLLEVKGRSAQWVRVEGELDRGLIGAPAFHVETGELVGLVRGSTHADRSRGHLVPAEALLDFESLNLEPPG